MIPGPDQVVSCPRCRQLARYRTLLSGNTAGMRMWTDGKRYARFLPQPPPFVRCDACGGFYFLRDAAVVGEFVSGSKDTEAIPADWRAAPRVEEPSEAEFYLALRDGAPRDHDDERLIRIRAWWAGNDEDRLKDDPTGALEWIASFRRSEEQHLASLRAVKRERRERLFERDPSLRRRFVRWKRRPRRPPTPEARAENLRALLVLMDEAKEEDLLLKAELLRELGRWQQAEEILDQVRSPQYASLVKQLRAHCASRDSRVHEFDSRPQ